jgi:hypothetical protein
MGLRGGANVSWGPPLYKTCISNILESGKTIMRAIYTAEIFVLVELNKEK